MEEITKTFTAAQVAAAVDKAIEARLTNMELGEYVEETATREERARYRLYSLTAGTAAKAVLDALGLGVTHLDGTPVFTELLEQRKDETD